MRKNIDQTVGEEIANSVSHGAGAVLALAGTAVIVVKAALTSGALSVTSVALYGASLIILYMFSTLYHSITNATAKRIFRVFDHCSIFLLILGSYIPISLCLIKGVFGWCLFGINSACAIAGIVFNSIDLERWKKLSMFLYVLMGWSVLLSIKTVVSAVDITGIILLAGGGAMYTLGIIFYKNKSVEYMHFIWHIFVLCGSILHYFFILKYCLL